MTDCTNTAVGQPTLSSTYDYRTKYHPQPGVEPRHPRKIRFTSEEWATITARAADCGTPPARYVREAALGEMPRVRRPQINAELLRQLTRIGNNLNQLARLAHLRDELPNATKLQAVLETILDVARTIEARE
jgi:hypothetical protein